MKSKKQEPGTSVEEAADSRDADSAPKPLSESRQSGIEPSKNDSQREDETLSPSGELVALDAQLEDARQRSAGPQKLADLHCSRAKKRLEFGFSLGALADMTSVYDLRARFSNPSTYIEDARFAEVLRVHARDRLLSTKDASDFCETVDRSIELFSGARAKAQREDARPEELAWIIAHLGAAHTMRYWIAITQNPDDAADGKLDLGGEHFEAAREAFDEAIAQKKEYPWAERFRAFLYALRGKPGPEGGANSDFWNAIEGLEKLIGPGKGEQASLHRSLSMLLSYVAVQSTDAGAAHKSIAAGLQAMSLDSEEFHAPHSVAASLWYLAKFGPEDDRPKYDAQLRAAIESARVRTKNIVSQASAVLASLALIEGIAEQSQTKAEQAIAAAKEVLENFARMGIPLDLESSAMTIRSPAVAVMRQWASDPESPYYSRSNRVRSELKPIIHALRAKLA